MTSTKGGESKLNKVLSKFLKQQQDLADKYGCKIEIGQPGNMITIADGTKKESK